MPAQAQSQSPTQQPAHGPTGQMPGVRPYRVQIADDHGVVRRGIRAILELEPGLDITSESAATRRLYGLDQRHTTAFGKQCLLARRLAESARQKFRGSDLCRRMGRD